VSRHIKYIVRSIALFLITSFIAYFFYKKYGNDPFGYLNLVKDKGAKTRIKAEDYTYFEALKNFFTLDWKRSYYSKLPVTDIIKRGFVNTLFYGAAPLTLAYLTSPFIGVAISRVKNKVATKFIDLFLALGISFPVLSLAYVIILINNKLDIAPSFVQTPYSLSELIMPWIVMYLAFSPYWISISKSKAVELSNSTSIGVAKFWGISKSKIWRYYYVKQMMPSYNEISLIDISYALGGVLVVEYAFGIKGLGYVFLQSVFSGDLPVFMTWLFISILTFIVVTHSIRVQKHTINEIS
jgi:peptide/nickel transport system permease protein